MNRILSAGIEHIDPEKFKSPFAPVEDVNDIMCSLNKPNGCLWGSTLLKHGLYLSDWIRYVSECNFHTEKYVKGISYTLLKRAKICEIKTIKDYISIMETYSMIDDVVSWEKIINWTLLASDFDAFHLSSNAFWRLRLPLRRLEDKEGNRLADFYAYDCETWIIFNLDCINKDSIMNHKIEIIPET